VISNDISCKRKQKKACSSCGQVKAQNVCQTIGWEREKV